MKQIELLPICADSDRIDEYQEKILEHYASIVIRRRILFTTHLFLPVSSMVEIQHFLFQYCEESCTKLDLHTISVYPWRIYQWRMNKWLATVFYCNDNTSTFDHRVGSQDFTTTIANINS